MKPLHERALTFLRSLIRKMIKGKIEIVTFGVWDAGVSGSYGLSFYWREKE